VSKHNGVVSLRQYTLVIGIIAILNFMSTNWSQVFEVIGLSPEFIFVFSFAVTLFATWSFVQRNLASVKIEGFTKSLLMLGLTLTFTGFATALFALAASPMAFKRGLGEFLSLYTQLSLNFLLGGLSLIGASLPALQSLSKQGASQPTQCGGESGDRQQDK